MKSILQILRSPRRAQGIIWVGFVLAMLTACGTVAPVAETSAPDRFEYITTISIDSGTRQADIEATYDATAVVFRPEAGFAILGFNQSEGRLALMSDADANQDMIVAPEVTAGGWTAWSGGWTAWSGGWTAWSGGWTAWSGGWTAWSGGWTAWSGGIDTRSTFGENLFAWNDIKLPQGQLMAPGLGAGVKVAVIDTGVSLNHSALAGRLAPSSEWRDFIDDDSYPMDEAGGDSTGHGTAVAGIVLQVAPNATILPIRVLDADGSGDVDDVVQGIDHAVAMGADVINLSLGTDTDVSALQAMIDYATGQEIFVITSLGNEGSSDITFPARYAKNGGNTGHYLISVGSIGKGDKKSGFSNYGSSAELFAPGEAIYSLANDVGSDSLINHTTGTSFATPMVAGSVALALGEAPTSAQRSSIPTMLTQAADDLEAENPGYSGQLGSGRLNVAGFLGNLGYSAPTPQLQALLVANLSPSSSTVFLEERLELLGFQVTLIDDDDVRTSDAGGKDLVIVSHTVSSGDITDKFRDVAVPVITWEDGIFDDMDLVSSRGDVDNATDISIVTSHPLAAGFSGDIEVYEDEDRLAWGTPSSSAITVATVPGQPNRAVIFAYEAGAQMVGRTAPAKRVGFFFQNYDADKYGFRGVTLFDAAVLWATADGSTASPSVSTPGAPSMHIQTEAASRVEGAFELVHDGAVSGDAYMRVPSGAGQDYDGDESPMGRLHFDLDAVPSGSYHVWLRVTGPDDGSNSFFVRMDDGAKSALHYASNSGWLWQKAEGVFVLAGDHTLTVMLREDSAAVDEILITDDPTFTPSGEGGY